MESKELKVFNYLNNDVRVVTKEGEPWFVAADVCKVLEIDQVTNAIRKLDDDEKKATLISIKGGNGAVSTKEVNIVSEPGLYSLVLGSRKPEAKAFKRWVTHEVIPTIRKHGVYMTDRAIEQTIQDPDYIIGIVQALKQEKQQRLALEAEKAVMLPKAEYCDAVLLSESLIATNVIAKDYGMSATTFNKMLERMGIQYKRGNVWALKAKYQDKGYMKSATFKYDDSNNTYIWNKWTEAGRMFLYEELRDRGILPLSERTDGKRWQTNII